MKVVLISPYELGRQPFGLAHPAAWLRREGCEVHTLDLALQKLDPDVLNGADLVAVYLAMHTATRIAVQALPRIRQLAPGAHLCAYGLYAPMNAELLNRLGVGTILGGEFEPGMVALVERLRAGEAPTDGEPQVHLGKIDFIQPDRSGMPALTRHAHLRLPDGGTKIVGFAEASRGCKHLCRHCPVVPVYGGRFRIVPIEVLLADVAAQVAEGAQHISFGDPDFLNGPTHARRLIHALHVRFPELTYDVTIKVEHLLEHSSLLSELRDTGCLFITSAVESVDDRILAYLSKNHTHTDFVRAVQLLREAGIALAPTFVPFTPWTTLEGYLDLLQQLVTLLLIEAVPPIQLAIRLLVPECSYLLQLPEFMQHAGAFDPAILGYPWRNPDVRVDTLQSEIQDWVAQAEGQGLSRREIFTRIWELAHRAAARPVPALPVNLGASIPHLSEPWYCCAEPTHQQLQSF